MKYYAKPGEKEFLKYRYFLSIHKLTTTANVVFNCACQLDPRKAIDKFQTFFLSQLRLLHRRRKKIRHVFSRCIMNLFCQLWAVYNMQFQGFYIYQVCFLKFSPFVFTFLTTKLIQTCNYFRLGWLNFFEIASPNLYANLALCLCDLKIL